jgi:two-component system sensor histidine kinase KdpD
VRSFLKFDVVRRELRGIVIALLLVAGTTVIALLVREYLGVLRGSALYLIPVMIAGYHLGLLSALTAAVAGILWSGYLFFTPQYNLYITRPQEIINLTLFTLVALVVSHLANSAKRQTLVARKREQEVSGLYAFSRRLAAAPTAADIFTAIQKHLANLVQRDVVLFGPAESDYGHGVPEPARAAAARVQQGPDRDITIADERGNIWLIRRVSHSTPDFGVVAVNMGTVPERALTDLQQRIDEALAEAAATLERLDIARALNEAKMRSEAELLREALIGSVSHELRTPLASILGAATVLCNAPALAQDERLAALAGVVRDEAERLNNDIQNLLDATTISRAQVRPKMQWVEPVDIVNSALERRRRRLAGRNVTVNLDSNLPIVHVDPVQVERALVQILDNAAKYSDAPIEVTARANGAAVVLSVEDRGAGITESEKQQVGERFYRGPRHTTLTPGSGLGLWVAGAFVTANGGKVEVESPGADLGTTVSIHLPLSPHAAAIGAAVDD